MDSSIDLNKASNADRDLNIIANLNELGEAYGNKNAKDAIRELMEVYNTLFPQKGLVAQELDRKESTPKKTRPFLKRAGNVAKRAGKFAIGTSREVARGVGMATQIMIP